MGGREAEGGYHPGAPGSGPSPDEFRLSTLHSTASMTMTSRIAFIITFLFPRHDLPSMRVGTHPIVFRGDSSQSRWPFYRFIQEIPLILVCLLLGWAQYTLTFSLVLNYLIFNRKQYQLGVSVLVPFELSWILTVASLMACVITGPGLVQPTGERGCENGSGLEHGPAAGTIHPSSTHQPREETVPLGMLPPRRPRRWPHPYAKPRNPIGYSGVGQDSDDEDQCEDEGEAELEGATVTSRRSGSTSNLLSNPRSITDLRSNSSGPSSFALLPRYPLQPRDLPPSSLTFQEQVQLAEQRSPTRLDFVGALNNLPPPLPASSSTSFRDREPSDLNTLMCKSDGSKRFCRKCNLLKADRAHHCSSCGVCVLRMDHHCPWLGGRCVGLQNHKYFVLFVMWCSITAIVCAFAAFKGLSDFVTINAHLSDDGFRLAPLNWAFLFLVGTLFGLVLTGFGSYHLYLVSVNRTTIENMERSLRVRPTVSSDSSTSYGLLRPNLHSVNVHNKLFSSAGHDNTNPQDTLPSYNLPVYKSDDRLSRSERKKLEAAATKLNVYDLGSRLANFKEIFGRRSRWWEWPLPIRPRGISDGYEYRVNAEHLSRLRELTAEVRLLPSDRSNELRFERP